MKKFRKYQPQHKVITYEELEEIVQAHRHGDEEAGLRLINAFYPYMNKFKRLICDGHADVTDKEIRAFIGLYMPKAKSMKNGSFRRNKTALYDMYKTVGIIKDLFREHSQEDIEHELYIALFKLAERYTPYGNSFHTYVARAYRFQLKRQLTDIIETHVVSTKMHFFDDVHMDEDGDFSKTYVENAHLLLNEPFDEINDNWVNGWTASDMFHLISKMDRRLLKMKYIDKKTDEEIAFELGICRATANRRRQRAILTLQNEMRKLNALAE